MHQREPRNPQKFNGKACFPCTHAKRRCDKSLPACRRCVDRIVDCCYPSIRPYTRRPKAAEQTASVDTSVQNGRGIKPGGPAAVVLPNEVAAGALGESMAFDACASRVRAQIQIIPPINNDNTLTGIYGSSDKSTSSSVVDATGQASCEALSLLSQSWLEQLSTDDFGAYTGYSPPNPSAWNDPNQDRPVRASAHRDFVKTIGGWVRGWARDGQCPFIHKELYADTGFPPCLQDAFACLAAYSVKTDATEEITWQLVERTADTLFLPLTCADIAQPLCEWLPRIQAGFLVLYIRLFDGDIRQRSLAEAHMETLLSWLKRLTIEADLFFPRLTFAAGGPSQTPSATAASHLTVARQWHEWILAESVRRTWIVAVYTLSVYRALRGDSVQCSGRIAFTMRAGLWDAKSATAWAGIVAAKDALFTEPLGADLMDSIAAIGEVDAFVRPVVSIM